MTSYTPSTQPPAALRGWRAQVWTGVLFVALLKGLIPHAALASVLMQGNPALVWCAPGTVAVDAKAASSMPASAHDCVCASFGDSALQIAAPEAPDAQRAPDLLLSRSLHVAEIHRARLPPARGPPKA